MASDMSSLKPYKSIYKECDGNSCSCGCSEPNELNKLIVIDIAKGFEDTNY